MTDITALILTYNEKENIGRSLEALQWIGKVLIVDSFSTDETLAIARKSRPDALVEQRAFRSFADQCNAGLSLIQTEWVLSLDADYVIPTSLSEEIQSLIGVSGVNGYSASFCYCVFGRPLRSTLYPSRTVLYRRSYARYHDEGHGHRVEVNGKVERLRGTIVHDDRKPLQRWIVAQSRYVDVETAHLLSTPDAQLNRQDRLRKRIFYAGPTLFFYLLLGKGLIMDGWPGWFYVSQRVIAELLLSLRLITERYHLGSKPDAPRL